jgi:hypothetical protein
MQFIPFHLVELGTDHQPVDDGYLEFVNHGGVDDNDLRLDSQLQLLLSGYPDRGGQCSRAVGDTGSPRQRHR